MVKTYKEVLQESEPKEVLEEATSPEMKRAINLILDIAENRADRKKSADRASELTRVRKELDQHLDKFEKQWAMEL